MVESKDEEEQDFAEFKVTPSIAKDSGALQEAGKDLSNLEDLLKLEISCGDLIELVRGVEYGEFTDEFLFNLFGSQLHSQTYKDSLFPRDFVAFYFKTEGLK